MPVPAGSAARARVAATRYRAGRR